MPELSVNPLEQPPSPVAGAQPLLAGAVAAVTPVAARPPELGGPAGPEPTRYGDWEKAGRCIDF